MKPEMKLPERPEPFTGMPIRALRKFFARPHSPSLDFGSNDEKKRAMRSFQRARRRPMPSTSDVFGVSNNAAYAIACSLALPYTFNITSFSHILRRY